MNDTAFTELRVPRTTASALQPRLKKDSLNIVIALSRDQIFVFNLLRKLYALRESYPLLVVGLPDWVGFSGLDPEYMMALNVHIIQDSWVDYRDPSVRDFVLEFREDFSTEPDSFAFQGYDLAIHFFRMLMNYGQEFPRCAAEVKHKGLQTTYQFRQTPGNGFSNTYVNVFRFVDFQEVDARTHPYVYDP